jgi:cytochrome c-type biogenesis protein CcmH
VTAFIVIATVMVAIALAWILWPLLRGARRPTVERHVANANIYRDQFVELDADLKRGTISEAQYEEARSELERRLLEEAKGEKGAAPPPMRPARGAAVLLAVMVPVLAGLLYWKLGAPDAFSPIAKMNDPNHHMTPDQVQKMVGDLAARLEKEPDNVDGWVILAKTYYTMRDFPKAAAAYERLVKLVPNEPDLLADYADALAMSQGRNIQGKPMELINAALKVDPNHWKALAMAGTAAFDAKDYKKAVEYWERLRDTQPADSPLAKSIAPGIAEARQLAGMPAVAVADASKAAADPHKGLKMPSPSAAPAAKAAAGGATSVGGTVTLSDAVKAKAAPGDMVFIFARPAEGSRMPLALTAVKVSDLPAKFTLDDTMSMSETKLSGVPQVIVGARVSKSGKPMPSSGDLEGLSKPVAVGAKDVVITIDRVLP